MLEQTVYSLQSGLNYSKFIGHNLAVVSDHPARSCSLHPDSTKVSDEPPCKSPLSVTKPSKQFIAHEGTTGVAPTFEVPPLPAMVSLKKIYADLLGYLFGHGTLALTIGFLMMTLAEARDFFQNNTVDGPIIWTRLGQQVTICLATPNGWETSQQVRLYHPSMTITCTDNDT